MSESATRWYKDAIIYELHVRSYFDSHGEGTGDFRGLTQKLDYLHDLGVTAIWLLPFYPSPLRDDGYDTADYLNINPDYGTLETFREFMAAAHQRNMRVITELVINHTSDQHPWFQRARRAPPGSVERDFYVWSDTPEKYQGVRIIFQDTEPSNWSYDPVAKAYYWHRFYAHQPDLNFDNPAVREAIFPIMDYWFEMGVDGMRLDAVPYLYEREGTTCENLPETHAYLKALRKHVDEKYPDRMFLAEANQWPEDAISFFGNGDECHMAFHFPLMPRLFMAMHTEDRFPVVDIMQQTPHIPETCQWALFLRNHDELTLEMVSDEERDYMWRAFASERRARSNLGIRRRLAPLLGNNRRRMELMNGLLFSLPGTPVIYYGDEIGMGDNIYLGDRNGVRTPMQWSSDRNAGFSRANSQKLFLPVIIDPEYHYEALNVEAQQANPSSLLWWYKRLINLRKQFQAFSRGEIEFLTPRNRRILAYLRRYQDECVLVVANLSRFVQYVELDLAAFEGTRPVELLGGTRFPRVGKLPYLLTLGPHDFYWFSLASKKADEPVATKPVAPPLNLSLAHWEVLFTPSHSTLLRESLRHYLENQSTTGAGVKVRQVRLRDCFRLGADENRVRLVLCDVEYLGGVWETVAFRLAFANEKAMAEWPAGAEPPVAAQISGPSPGVIYIAAAEGAFMQQVLENLAQQRAAEGDQGGRLVGWSLPSLRESYNPAEPLPLVVHRSQEHDLTVRFGERWVLKFYRKIEEGQHPEVEMGRLLNQVSPPLAPQLLGAIEYHRRGVEPLTLGLLHEYASHESTAWQYTLDAMAAFFERQAAAATPAPLLADELMPAELAIPKECAPGLEDSLDMFAQLARRLAALHVALARPHERADFAPEPFNYPYQRSLYQSLRKRSSELLAMLEHEQERLPPEVHPVAQAVLAQRAALEARHRKLLDRLWPTTRIRCHGNCTLAHILFTGKDFLFMNFDGSAGHSIGERRIKRSPLRDVASVLVSFDYALQSLLSNLGTKGGRPRRLIREADRALLEPWGQVWRILVTQRFLREYWEAPHIKTLIPAEAAVLAQVLPIFLVERYLDECMTEIRLRPTWSGIPLTGLARMLAP